MKLLRSGEILKFHRQIVLREREICDENGEKSMNLHKDFKLSLKVYRFDFLLNAERFRFER